MNKYNARKTVVDGIQFDSIRESKRYGELKLLERAGEIRNLKIHHKYDIVVNRQKVCTYASDFDYYTKDNWHIVEDVKGVKTPVYRLKKKLMKALYNIDIQEI